MDETSNANKKQHEVLWKVAEKIVRKFRRLEEVETPLWNNIDTSVMNLSIFFWNLNAHNEWTERFAEIRFQI